MLHGSTGKYLVVVVVVVVVVVKVRLVVCVHTRKQLEELKYLTYSAHNPAALAVQGTWTLSPTPSLPSSLLSTRRVQNTGGSLEPAQTHEGLLSLRKHIASANTHSHTHTHLYYPLRKIIIIINIIIVSLNKARFCRPFSYVSHSTVARRVLS